MVESQHSMMAPAATSELLKVGIPIRKQKCVALIGGIPLTNDSQSPNLCEKAAADTQSAMLSPVVSLLA